MDTELVRPLELVAGTSVYQALYQLTKQ